MAAGVGDCVKHMCDLTTVGVKQHQAEWLVPPLQTNPQQSEKAAGFVIYLNLTYNMKTFK